MIRILALAGVSEAIGTPTNTNRRATIILIVRIQGLNAKANGR